MVKTKKTLFTVVLAVVCLICFACALSLRSTGKARADGEKLIDVDATTVAGLSYGAVSVDATTGGKLGSGLLVSGTSGVINVPFSVADFKTLTVGNNPYFASVLDYDYENEIVPFFTLVIDSAFLDNGNGYNCIWFAVKTESGTISQFNLTIRKNGANVPPYFFNDRSWSLDDDNAEQYVIRAFVDYANGKLYYCTGLEIGTTRNVADYCTVIDYDFEGSGLFNCSTGYLEFEIGNGMGGGSTVPVNVWVKDLCGERNFNASIKYESALTCSYGGTLTVPNATISYLGVDYAAAKSVTAPNGDPAVIGSTIDQLGNYTVRYSINKGGKIYYKDAVLRIVEPVLVNTDNNAVYEAISIDDTTGKKLGSAYNVSNGAYVFPFSMTTFKTLTVPTTRLKSLFNSEGRDPDMEDIVPLATIICRGTGFITETTGIDIKIGTDLSNGNIDELNLRMRAAAGGTSVPGLLWHNNYPVNDEFGEQKAIRIYADYTNGKILVTCGLAIDNDDRMMNYLNNRINYDFAATGMFEGETGFITVQCFDYVAGGQAANCTAYVKNICGVEAGLVPTVSASAIGDCCPDGTAMDIPAGTVAFLGNNESADVALFNPAGNNIATDTAITEAGEYTVRYSLTKGINVFYKDYAVEVAHDFGEWIAEVPATCTANGVKGHKDCSVCNKHFDAEGVEIADLTIAALGHDYNSVAEVPATCEGTGVAAHYECSRCDKLFTYDGLEYTEVSAGSLTIAATGHTYGSWIEEVPATCAANGVKAHKDCTVCHKHFDADGNEIADLTIAATEHTFGEWIAEVPAAIGVAGTLGHYHCSACGKDFDGEHVELNSLVISALDGIKWVSLSLKGDIGVNFYVYVGGAVELTANDGALVGESVTKEGIDCFKFTINVAAKDYKKNVAIGIDGTAISATYKVETYIDAIAVESPAYDLVQSLKTYCEAARAFFAEETPTAADDVSIAAENAVAVTGEDNDITLMGATLILETKTAINVYFKAASLDGKTFTVDGEAVVPKAVDGYANLYMITIDDIAAQDLEVKYTIVVGGYTITYSALSYAYAVVNNAESGVAIANVAKALYNYNVQANAYAAL